jgi:DNA modification methylase
MMAKRPIVCVTDVDGKLFPLGGNMRLKALKEAGYTDIPDEWVTMADEWTQEQRNEFIIKDNISFGEHDWDALKDWDTEQLEEWGLEVPEFKDAIDESEEGDEKNQAVEKLQDKFIVPPFSILNTREGYWQERKKHWNNLIGDNGESREGLLKKDSKLIESTHSHNSVSLLDSVLAELVNLWFGLPNSNTFDCFAGDSVFGYVSSYLGNSFTGIELRKEQADLNNKRIKGFNSKYICDDGRNILNHIEEKSQDLLFSCPPYFDLEVYSDLPNDASNQKEYSEFLKILDTAFTNAIKCLKDNRFAVITVGDIRDKNGIYFRFPDHIKDIFTKNGMLFYQELILVEPIGNLAMRVSKYMETRKVGKCHQNVLVFYKGNLKEIKNIFPKIKIKHNDEESED